MAFGVAESVTVDLAVAQPVRVAFGDGGFSGTELLSSAEIGGLTGGVTGGLGSGARAAAEAADSAENASTALNAVGRISTGLDTAPGRMAFGAAVATGQDALFNGGRINPLNVALGAVSGAAAKSGTTTEKLGTRREQAWRNSEQSTYAAPPKTPGDGVLPTGDPVYHRSGSTAVGYDRATMSNFDKVAPKPGYHDVVVHGNPQGYFEPGRINPAGNDFPGGESHPSHIVDAIRNNPNYDGGPVRLISCHSGTVDPSADALPAAQQVANQLGVPVKAPTKKVGIMRGGGDGQEPIIFDGGYWRTFLPLVS
ncbi:hypothetical protein ABZ876_00590 [Streptomyces sp. NPDC046931]|uniref:hypothetical protein n=1 Tax=Streptomyces sp. NPDC046931 TaxID=3154806 RepID=UPI003411BD00